MPPEINTDMDILSAPWAITPGALERIANLVYQGREAVVESVETVAFSDTGSGDDVNLDVRDHVAVIRITGALYRWNYQRIRREVVAAVKDPSIRAICLLVDSPGGLVSGCKELGDFLFDAGKQKHIYAYADGQMCSAAFWLASMARDISAPQTAAVGSIGVRTLHIDWSKWNQDMGLAFTHLAAGEYKALGNEDEPLNKKARAYFQEKLDTLYSIFIDAVARNRRVSTEKAQGMADGKVFLADQALELGLIDRIDQDFETYFSSILKKEKIMDLETLKRDHPDLYSQVLDQGKQAERAETEQKIKDAVSVAVTGESDRVLGLASAVMGEEAAESFTQVVKSGASVEQVQALKGIFVPDAAGHDDGEGDDGDAAAGGKGASRSAILAALQQGHSQGVTPQKGRDSTANKGSQSDIEKQASEYVRLLT
ncbi:S49 family peptidase [Desulfotignum balticum]|uniref:S49 family peptidase n=1 Tax=Desulfotignum balticum TaxID=115781 RepID=UPI0003F92ED4|nr:S49 family peptidase [Desulfotignum balticum]